MGSTVSSPTRWGLGKCIYPRGREAGAELTRLFSSLASFRVRRKVSIYSFLFVTLSHLKLITPPSFFFQTLQTISFFAHLKSKGVWGRESSFAFFRLLELGLTLFSHLPQRSWSSALSRSFTTGALSSRDSLLEYVPSSSRRWLFSSSSTRTHRVVLTFSDPCPSVPRNANGTTRDSTNSTYQPFGRRRRTWNARTRDEGQARHEEAEEGCAQPHEGCPEHHGNLPHRHYFVRDRHEGRAYAQRSQVEVSLHLARFDLLRRVVSADLSFLLSSRRYIIVDEGHRLKVRLRLVISASLDVPWSSLLTSFPFFLYRRTWIASECHDRFHIVND